MSWTLRKKLAQKRSRGGRWCWTHKLAEKRSRGGRRCWARERERVGLLLLQLCVATDMVFVTLFCIAVGTGIAGCGGRCAMPDGLTLP